MDKKQKSGRNQGVVTSDSTFELRVTLAEMHVDFAEKYCTKDDVDKRIGDIRGTIWHVVVPLMIAMFGLIVGIMYLLMKGS